MDKLVKSLESLRVVQAGDDARKKDLVSLKKEKVLLCNAIADCICTLTLRNHVDFPKCLTAALEAFFSLCDDSDSDVRMAADDCVNKCTKILLESHLSRLQVEFYKEIKKGSASPASSARLIRAALSRFAETAHLIRPSKRRAYAQNLLPCIGRIAADRRDDEAIQEALVAAMNKMAPVLAPFATDQELKALCKPFLGNLNSIVATARRTAAASLVLICSHSRTAPASAFAWLLDQLFDTVLPLLGNLRPFSGAASTVLGVLLCFRHILAQATTVPVNVNPAGSSGINDVAIDCEELLSSRHVLMIYELLLFFIGGGQWKDTAPAGADSTIIVTAALEALLQLLRAPPPSLAQLLVTRGSIAQSVLGEALLAQKAVFASSHTTGAGMPLQDQSLEDEAGPEGEISALTGDASGSSNAGSSGNSRSTSPSQSDEEGSDTEGLIGMPQHGLDRTTLAESMSTIDSAAEAAETEDMTLSASDDKLQAVLAQRWRQTVPSASQDQLDSAAESLSNIADTSSVQSGEATVGSNADETAAAAAEEAAPVAVIADLVGEMFDLQERPAVYCGRLLSARFLLSGCALPPDATAAPTLDIRTISDRRVRVSIKALALSCMAQIAARSPDVLSLPLFRGSTADAAGVTSAKGQLMRDVLLFAQHHDPQLQGNAALVLGATICGLVHLPCIPHAHEKGPSGVDGAEHLRQTVATYVAELAHLLYNVKSSVTVRLVLSAVGFCLPALMRSVHCGQALILVTALERHAKDSYWLAKVELLEILAAMDFRTMHYIEQALGLGEGGSNGSIDNAASASPLLPSLQDRLMTRVLLCLLGDDDARVRHAASHALVRLLPSLFYPDDNPLHDPVVAHAQRGAADYLSPSVLLNSGGTKQLPPVVHGLAPSFVPAFDRQRGSTEDELRLQCTLSRVVSMLLDAFSQTSSRSLKVGVCHALSQLSQQYATTRYAIAWGCACGTSMRVRLAATSDSISSPKERSQAEATAMSSRLYQPGVNSVQAGRSNDANTVHRSLSVEEPRMSGGGGPLSLVLALLSCSTTFALDLTAHADALLLAGNLFAGAACAAITSIEHKKQGAPGSAEHAKIWPALQDRSLVPAVEKLLGHVARLLNIFTQVIDDVTPGTVGGSPKAAMLAAIQTASQAAASTSNSSPLKKLVAATRSVQSPDKTGVQTPGQRQQQPGTPVQGSPVSAGQVPPKTPKEVERELKTKREILGSYQTFPHYMKIYEVVRGAYSNYKVSLDLSAPDKFTSLLGAALVALGQILEVASLDDTAKCAEELLAYLKTSATIDPTKTMTCVHQLLKAMFGTNLASQCPTAGDRNALLALTGLGDDKAARGTSSPSKPGVYSAFFAQPYAYLSQSLALGGAAAAAALAAAAAVSGASTTGGSVRTMDEDAGSAINILRKRIERKMPLILKPESKIDKGTVAAYIRLFEPLVIRALKAYMVTSSAELQRQVLDLLIQLVQLRVNYCLLDHEQIFLGFVIKQVEMIGEGPLRDTAPLISSIFCFLVSLSYEKFHSKNVIGMPKIIQLCDGILASGHDPRSHAIPALDMIVYDLFLTRGVSASKSPDGGKDLDAQREVVVSMLLRLTSYYEVAELLVIVLHQCFKEGEDKWKKMSRLVVDTMLPLLAKQKVNADSINGLQAIHRLMQAVSPSVYRPVDAVLKAMFVQPAVLSTTTHVQRWVSAVLVLLRILVSQGKEEVMLSRLSELKLSLGAAAVPPFANSLPSVSSSFLSSPLGASTATGDATTVTAAGPASSDIPPPALASERIQSLAAPSLMYESNSSDQSSTIQQPQPEDLFASFLIQVIAYVSARLEQDLLLGVGDASERSLGFTVTQLSHLMLYASYMFQSGHFRRMTRFLTEHLRDSTSPFYYQIQQLNERLRGGSTAADRYPVLVLLWRHLLILLDFDDQGWWYDVVQSTTIQTSLPTPEPACCASVVAADIDLRTSGSNAHSLGDEALFESTTSSNSVPHTSRLLLSINEEVLRRGTLMLFCDYVVDNLQHAEQTTWLIVNHVSDLVDLCCEVPVQDFISAVHRNPAASGLFVHAVHSRYQFAGKQLPSRGKRALACLRGAHTSQSGALLALLLDKFLLDEETRHTSLARLCDSVACRRLEILLAEPVEQVLQQLAPEDVKRLLCYAKSPLLAARHCRLLSLLEKLAAMLQPFSSSLAAGRFSGSECEGEASLLVTPAVSCDEQAASGSCSPQVPIANKETFLSVVIAESCHRAGISPEDMSANASVCASLLGQLEYADIMAIMAREDFQLSVLTECMDASIKASTEFLETSQEGRDSSLASPLNSALFRASRDTVLSRTAEVTAMTSAMPDLGTAQLPRCGREVSVVILREAAAFVSEKSHSYLVAALAAYLGIVRRFGPQFGSVPKASWNEICNFVMLALAAIHWQLACHKRQRPHLQQYSSDLPLSLREVDATVTVLAEVLHHGEMFSVLCSDSDCHGSESVAEPPTFTSKVATIVLTLYEIVNHYMICNHGGISLEESHAQQNVGLNEVGWKASELVECLSTHLSDKHDCLPMFLRHPLTNAIKGLARHPFVSAYAHIPMRAWSAGVVTVVLPAGAGARGTGSELLPSLAGSVLQDASLFKDYVRRVNTIGWCNRQQFEETWVTFLEFVSASSMGQTADEGEADLGALAASGGDGAYEEEAAAAMERTLLAVVALRAIVGLLMRTSPSARHTYSETGRKPSAVCTRFLGPAALRTRLPFMDTVNGLKLQSMRKLIDLQLCADIPCCEEDSGSSCASPVSGVTVSARLNGGNAVGDVLNKQVVMEKSETELPEKEAWATVTAAADRYWQTDVDVQSCLRLLTDTFGDWLATAASTSAIPLRRPLMLVSETVRTVTILSDLFVTASQYEWMYDVFSNLQKSQYMEDELIGHYIIHGLAKSAAAVLASPSLKLDAAAKEKVIKCVEGALKSNHVPTRMSGMSGSLHLLCAKDPDVVRLLLPVVTESARQQLSSLDKPIIFSEDNLVVLWSTVFYILENFSDLIKDTDIRSMAIEIAVKKMNAQEENMTSRILCVLVNSLEHLLLLQGFLTEDERDTLAKSACDRMSQRHPQHALIALSLLLTCMYSESTQQPRATLPGDPQGRQQPALLVGNSEGNIVARMEQITVLFDRIRKGYPDEAQVVAQLLPTLLNDFFPIQDVMNKVIGEFLSSQQPHPQLLAGVVFKVFEERIVMKRELSLIQDWVMLSLGNFTQRTPLSMAMWSLTCFFVSASANQWLRAMFPHVVSSMGRADASSERLFHTAALDFYAGLPSDAARRIFVATFQAAAAAATVVDARPYSWLLLACSALPGTGPQPSLVAK